MDLAQTKSYAQIEQVWNIRIPIAVRNSITVLVNTVKKWHRDTQQSQLQEPKTTPESMIRACGQGGSKATKLLLKELRIHW